MFPVLLAWGCPGSGCQAGGQLSSILTAAQARPGQLLPDVGVLKGWQKGQARKDSLGQAALGSAGGPGPDGREPSEEARAAACESSLLCQPKA